VSEVVEFPTNPEAPVGTIVSTELGSTAIVLIRHADGWAAVPEHCPHAGCRLSRKGQVIEGNVLVCNCHGAEFDLTSGEVLLDPAETPPLQLLELAISPDGTSASVVDPADVNPR
jgi:nitrite reductase/ring-hydroxylating ferredoxin subunit